MHSILHECVYHWYTEMSPHSKVAVEMMQPLFFSCPGPVRLPPFQKEGALLNSPDITTCNLRCLLTLDVRSEDPSHVHGRKSQLIVATPGQRLFYFTARL